jgi:hypothetical protein
MSIVKFPRQSGLLSAAATWDDGVAFVDGDSIGSPRSSGAPNPDGLGRTPINPTNSNIYLRVVSGEHILVGPVDGSAASNSFTIGDYQTTGVVASFPAVGTGGGTTGYVKPLVEAGAILEINGCVLDGALAAKYFSQYPTDATYGSYGNGITVDGGEIRFNVPTGKIFGLQVGSATTSYRRLEMKNGGKITHTGAGKTLVKVFASDLSDCMIQGTGDTTTTNPGLQLFCSATADPVAATGIATDGCYHRASNLLVDQAGVVDFNGIGAPCYIDWNTVACLRGKNTTTDFRVVNVSVVRNSTALRRFVKVRVQHGTNITSTVAVNADENGLEFYGCTLKLVALSFTNTRCKAWGSLADGWNEWEVPDANGQSASSIPCSAIVGAYICTGRGTSGNPKVLNAANGGFSAVPVFSGRGYMECSQETTVGSLADPGEFYQHDKEHRSGTSFTGWTFVSAEDGTALRIGEIAALSNTGHNLTQPPPAGEEFGQVTFTTCRGNIGPSAFGQGHTPGTDCPGTDVWRIAGGSWVGAHANADGGSSQTWNNATGPSTLVGLINATVDANYADAVLAAQVTGNRIVRTSSGAKKSDGNTTWAQAAGWGIQQSAQNAAATAVILQAANTYATDWGRSADLPNFLNSRPGGGAEGPGRRLRTFYLVKAGVATGVDTAARTVQYTTAWAALAAQDMGAHVAFGGAHPDYISGLTSTALADFVDADWAGGPAFPSGSPTVTSVTVAPSTATVAIAATTTLTATVNGTNSPSQTVTWTSSNAAVATVATVTSTTGLVTGVTAGTVTITALSSQDGVTTGTATITVPAASAALITAGALSFDARNRLSYACASHEAAAEIDSALGGGTLTAIPTINGAILSSSPSAGVGYATGAGAAVTQATNRSTGVTCTGLSGAITTHTASLAAEASAAFVVTNTAVALGDVVLVSIRSGSNGGNTAAAVTAVAAGSYTIRVSNNNASGGTAETGAIVLNVAVVRAVSA